MPTPMRFRTDSAFAATSKARLARGLTSNWHNADDPDLKDIEPARPGDVWRTRWYAPEGAEGPIAGYDIFCPNCYDLHCWTTATNCGTKRERTGTNSDGTTFTFTACDHSGTGSCWQWTGSAEDNLLTAHPSLHCQKEFGGCGYHGWLQNGVLSDG